MVRHFGVPHPGTGRCGCQRMRAGAVCGAAIRPAVATAEVYLAIVRRTFQEAGRDIAFDKVQLGFDMYLLGLGISTLAGSRLFVQEAKARTHA